MNPNATSFQFNPSAAGGAPPPAGGGAAARQDSFTEYKNMVDSIEQEMDNADANNLVEAMNDVGIKQPPPAAVQPPSGLPSHLAKHAAEFWFPECRDCTCCNGFKHGCRCAPTHGGVCVCSGGVPGAAPPPVAPPPSYRGPPAGGGGGGGRGRGKAPCKFFRSPGGCRFGDNCRFAHM